MATTDTLSRRYYQDQLSLRAQAVRDFSQFWGLLDFNDLNGSFPSYAGAITHYFDTHRARAVDLANTYFGDLRELEDVPGGWIPATPQEIPFDKVWASMLATGPIPIKQALRKGWSPERAMGSAFTQSAGAATRLILDAGRDQILGNVQQDRHAVGWLRVASLRACAFCAMLASRGAVYRSKESGNFRSHSHCTCYARPMWTEDQALPSTTELFHDLWGESAGRPGAQKGADPANDRLNQFRRQLYAERNQ
ncbi:VG15 protein [Kutzneria chonburiensis]|uniref:Capsid maturation protease n=1 Tax=Kutzneria chonburiensis TaxID=1483604 RepID=A0ABV6N384_9PSEU|nr:hypothetical protein [Kutzneria chonburiensis]